MLSRAVYIRNWGGQRIAMLDQVVRATVALKENGVSSAEIILPGWTPEYLLQIDFRLEFARADGGPESHLGDCSFFIRRKVRAMDRDGGETWELTALSAEHLLDGRTIAYDAGSAESDKTGRADNLIKAYVDENLVSASDAARNIGVLSVAADLGAGPTVSKSAGRQNLLRVAQELAEESGQKGTRLVFGLVAVGGEFVCATWAGQRGLDRSGSGIGAPTIFSPELGNLTSANYTIDHTQEATTAYAAGPGSGDDRVVVTATDALREERSPFARRELFASGGSSQDQIQGVADAAVAENRPTMTFEGEVVAGHPSTRFQIHWDWGDQAHWQWRGLGGAAVLDPVSIEWAGGAERIKALMRGEGRVAGWDITSQILQEVGAIQRHLQRQTGEGAPLSNHAGAGAPGVNDDASAGYQVGSDWLDTAANRWYRCRDATGGAAVWDALN